MSNRTSIETNDYSDILFSIKNKSRINKIRGHKEKIQLLEAQKLLSQFEKINFLYAKTTMHREKVNYVSRYRYLINQINNTFDFTHDKNVQQIRVKMGSVLLSIIELEKQRILKRLDQYKLFPRYHIPDEHWHIGQNDKNFYDAILQGPYAPLEGSFYSNNGPFTPFIDENSHYAPELPMQHQQIAQYHPTQVATIPAKVYAKPSAPTSMPAAAPSSEIIVPPSATEILPAGASPKSRYQQNLESFYLLTRYQGLRLVQELQILKIRYVEAQKLREKTHRLHNIFHFFNEKVYPFDFTRDIETVAIRKRLNEMLLTFSQVNYDEVDIKEDLSEFALIFPEDVQSVPSTVIEHSLDHEQQEKAFFEQAKEQISKLQEVSALAYEEEQYLETEEALEENQTEDDVIEEIYDEEEFISEQQSYVEENIEEYVEENVQQQNETPEQPKYIDTPEEFVAVENVSVEQQELETEEQSDRNEIEIYHPQNQIYTEPTEIEHVFVDNIEEVHADANTDTDQDTDAIFEQRLETQSEQEITADEAMLPTEQEMDHWYQQHIDDNEDEDDFFVDDEQSQSALVSTEEIEEHADLEEFDQFEELEELEATNWRNAEVDILETQQQPSEAIQAIENQTDWRSSAVHKSEAELAEDGELEGEELLDFAEQEDLSAMEPFSEQIEEIEFSDWRKASIEPSEEIVAIDETRIFEIIGHTKEDLLALSELQIVELMNYLSQLFGENIYTDLQYAEEIYFTAQYCKDLIYADDPNLPHDLLLMLDGMSDLLTINL